MGKSQRYLFIFTFILVGSLWPVTRCPAQNKKLPQTGLPNVIFIVLDAARADHFSCYGYPRQTTPCIDKISAQGAVFLNHFSLGTATNQSIPEIFFSRYFTLEVLEFGSWRWKTKQEAPNNLFKKFDDQQITLTRALALAGYRTALFTSISSFFQGSYFLQQFDESFYGSLQPDRQQEGIVFLLDLWIKRNRSKPFFAYCHIFSPHTPYLAKEEEKEFFRSDQFPLVERVRQKSDKYVSGIENDFSTGWSQEELDILRGLYDSNLRQADKLVGLIYDNLKALDLEQQTIIIITADHGEHLGEHNILRHGYLAWDSVIKVPLIVVYPPLIPSGVEVKGLTESIDIMPTVIDACGIKLPAGKSMDGVSLFNCISNPSLGKDAVFPLQAVRNKKYKYLVTRGLLYDLKVDPKEEKNIAQDRPEIVKQMQQARLNRMAAYLARYDLANKEDPPDYPFYFAVSEFTITPASAVEMKNCSDTAETFSGLKNIATDKFYLLSSDWKYYGLFFLPGKNFFPALTFSAKLPGGVYRIQVLLETSDKSKEFLNPRKSGFRLRFGPGNPYVYPRRIKLADKLPGYAFYYLDLGKVKVKENNFSLAVEFKPPDINQTYIIRHIKFIPQRYFKKDNAAEFNQEESRRRIEAIKSLGYL